jgi:hypothetical protein
MIIPSAKTRIIKVKRCKAMGCDNDFMPLRPMQRACCPTCALAIVAAANAKKALAAAKQDRKETKAKLEKFKSRTDHANDTQKVFNALRREQCLALGMGCISCDTHKALQFHAGHYQNVKTHKALRFHPENVWLQCSQCNSDEGGNKIEYRKRLVNLIGVEKVEWLESGHEAKRWEIDELKALKSEFAKQLRELRNGN